MAPASRTVSPCSRASTTRSRSCPSRWSRAWSSTRPSSWSRLRSSTRSRRGCARSTSPSLGPPRSSPWCTPVRSRPCWPGPTRSRSERGFILSRVVVVGAGPAGLMAAWRAARAGHEVTVIERSNRVGGMAASHSVAGLRVDLGSHRLHPSTPPVILGALRALLGGDVQERTRNGRVRLGDRWIAFPLRAADLLTRTPRPFAVGAVRDAVLAPTRHPRADTFAEVVRAGLGPTVADAFYAPYVRKIWGVAPAELSGELARRRVSAGGPAAIAR